MASAQAGLTRDEELSAGRDTAVLFAGIASRDPAGGSASAPAVQEAVGRVVEVLAQATQLSSGRVLNRRELEVMALFPSPEAAAQAALRMHKYAQGLPPLPESLGMRIAIHWGPVGQRGEEVFGDSVNLALELVDAAMQGQILVSEQAASALGPALQQDVRPLQQVATKAGGRILLGELVPGSDVRVFSPGRPRVALHLVYRNKRLSRRRQADTAVVGRGEECDLAVADRGASRKHCTFTIEGAACVLRDHSANGTFLTIEGKREMTLRAGQIPLSGRGRIAFGRSAAVTDEIVQYSFDRL